MRNTALPPPGSFELAAVMNWIILGCPATCNCVWKGERERERERESAKKHCKIIIREMETDNYVCTLNHVQVNKFKLLQI